ncbi:MAG: type II secretion system protein [Phycisphaerales bacterium]
MSTSFSRPSCPSTSARRGFSLLELLVVMAILVIVMSIVIPSLGNFRNSARRSASLQLMASLSTAVGQFNLDQRRLPGYFSPREMGNTTNTDFSAMENMLIDLSGGQTTDTGTGILTVGPGGPNGTIRIDPARVGAPTNTATGSVSKAYFVPDPKFFVRQNGAGQRAQANGPARDNPVIVDAWGSPILAWRQDAEPSDDPAFRFARQDSRQGVACFYAQSNAAFLNATSLGRLAINQNESSLLAHFDDTRRLNALTALLGNPSFAYDNINPPRPSAARAPIVFHSAGINGAYLGTSERGAKAAGPQGLRFAPNIDPITGGGFDDVIVTAQ